MWRVDLAARWSMHRCSGDETVSGAGTGDTAVIMDVLPSVELSSSDASLRWRFSSVPLMRGLLSSWLSLDMMPPPPIGAEARNARGVDSMESCAREREYGNASGCASIGARCRRAAGQQAARPSACRCHCTSVRLQDCRCAAASSTRLSQLLEGVMWI